MATQKENEESFKLTVEDFVQKVEVCLKESLRQISNQSLSGLYSDYMRSHKPRNTIAPFYLAPHVGPNQPYVIMMTNAATDSNNYRVPMYVLPPAEPIPQFDTYTEIEQNVEIDLSDIKEHSTGINDDSDNSRTVAFGGDPHNFVLDDAVFQLYMLLLGHMGSFSFGDWVPYFVHISQSKSSVLKRITKHLLEEHPLSTVQLNRYSNNNESHEEAADTFKTLLCIRCFQYDCVHHLEKSIRRRLKPSSDVSDETPTSDCDELDFLQQIMEGVADEKLDVADRLQSISSANFKNFLQTRRSRQLMVANNESHDDAPPYPNELSKELIKVLSTQKYPGKPKDGQMFSRYVPCHHDGPCTSINYACRCVIQQSACGKFCICFKEGCERQFRGCSCCRSSGPCRQSCNCYSFLRECDYDLCRKTSGSPCSNRSIQLGNRLQLKIGLSEVAGLGVFLQEPANKDQFVYEYCGEIITQAEADRRGRRYDQDRCSFLFNLNNEQVVDATHYGNKIRFANHSKKPNCYARLMVVNGDHRIGIYASKNLNAGEELFFDYQYTASTKLAAIGCERMSTTEESDNDQ